MEKVLFRNTEVQDRNKGMYAPHSFSVRENKVSPALEVVFRDEDESPTLIIEFGINDCENLRNALNTLLGD